MNRLIKMTRPTESIYYDQVDQIQLKQVEMIKKHRAAGIIRAP